MNKARLIAAFETEKQNFNRLPRRDSFSGLAVSERCNKIQQIMFARGYKFKPFITEINIEIS